MDSVHLGRLPQGRASDTKVNEPKDFRKRAWTLFRWVVCTLVLVPLATVWLMRATWVLLPGNFYVLWLIALVYWLCRATTRTNMELRSLRLATFLPAAVGLALSLGASIQAIRGLLGAFTVTSVAFLIRMLVWILLFPFEKGYVDWSRTQLNTWRGFWAIVAISIACYI